MSHHSDSDIDEVDCEHVEEVTDATLSMLGVEENEASRFVDYTVATPWESFVAEIEQTLKGWHAKAEDASVSAYTELQYEDFKFSLSLHHAKATSKDFISNTLIPLWFKTPLYAVLSHVHSTVTGSSRRRLLYSALITGLESTKCPIAVFYLPQSIDTLASATEVLGYALIPSLDPANRSKYDGTVHYHSTVYSAIHPKHELFYVDGLSRHFQHTLSTFSNGYINLAKERSHLSTWEQYDYYPRAAPPLYIPHNVAHPIMSSTLEDLAAAFPEREHNNLVKITSIGIQIHYKHLKLHSIVDNENYTTMLPSKLPPSAWTATAHFAPIATKTKSDIMNTTSSYANCLRRLLALYVCGKCCTSGVSIQSVLGEEMCVDEQKANGIAAILSLEAKAAVNMLAESLNHLDIVEDGTWNNFPSPQDLVMRVFSRSLWIDDDDDGGVGPAKPAVAPWNWLPQSRTSPVGSWLSLVSVYMGGLGDLRSSLAFWIECLREVRVHWENRLPIPRLHPPVPILRPHASPRKDGAVGRVDADTPLWSVPLWDDVIEKCRVSGTPFSCPDLTQCLVFQKLQMVNMCIITADEEAIVECPERIKNSQHDTPSTRVVFDDTLPAPRNITSELHDMDEMDGGSTQGTENASEHTSLEFSAKLEMEAEIIPPKLLRRLPSTTDAMAQHDHLSRKLNAGQSRSCNDNPLLRWQVSMPALVADIRSFKAYNPVAEFDTFVAWYGSAGTDLDAMQEIWSAATAMESEAQKPLFRAEQEAEKALGYLESLSMVQVAATTFCSAMTSIHLLLHEELRCSFEQSSSDTTRNIVREELAILEHAMSEAIEAIRSDTPEVNTTVRNDISINQRALVAMDTVCGLVSRIEQLPSRLLCCEQVTENNKQLAINMSRDGSVAAANADEAKLLLSLAKCSSFGMDSHTWHSFDGRELGAPSKKIVEIKCQSYAPNILPDSADRRQSEQVMRAFLESGQLRVAYALVELD